MKKTFFFLFLDNGVVDVATKLQKKKFFSLDYDVVNEVTKWKRTFLFLDQCVVKVVTK